jgi:hypothetical protein
LKLLFRITSSTFCATGAICTTPAHCGNDPILQRCTALWAILMLLSDITVPDLTRPAFVLISG